MRFVRLALVLAFTASSAHAATFLVGSDRDLIRSSAAVVVATAGESIAIRSPRGTIETVTRIHAEESVAGAIATGEDFDVTSLGGFVDGVGLIVPGAPRFNPGDRVLLCLEKDADGRWTPRAMALGKFTFRGERLLRDSSEIFGWQYDGTPHIERERAAKRFLEFVRETARGGDAAADYFVPRLLERAPDEVVTNATPSISSYLIQQGAKGMRWSTFPSPQVFLSNGSQPGANGGGVPSAKLGLNVWTSESGSNINYQYGGTTTAKGGLTSPDSVNSILFNDPNKEIPGSFTGVGGDVLAIGGAWFGSATHTFGGETFFTIQEADLVVQDGISGAGLTGNGFDHVLAHELGHTLGFRHSDKNGSDGPCDPSTMSCTASALMNSTVNFNNDATGAALQAWDREAASAVYGAGAPACTPPSITSQPQSATFGGSPIVLTVTAAGTQPLSYQWYAGSKGDVSHPASGGNGPTLTVSPQSTTTYWVRVTGACAPPADSEAATVTVNGCPAVFITGLSGTTTVIQGKSTQLSVSISAANRPVTIQWFAGARGDTSHPVSGGNTATITIAPPVTQTYWAQASNDCGANASSDPVTVTVIPCTAPSVAIQPVSAQVVSGSPASLSASISGTQPMQLQWFEGPLGDTSRPLPGAAAASVTTGPISTKTTFWLRATNDCGTVSTSLVTIDVVATCTAPTIVQPPDQAVPAGTTAIITAKASGPSLTFNWYRGPLLDFTHPVSGNGPSIVTGPITAATQYWVNVTNPCGSARSSTITVSPVNRRRAASGR